MENGAEALGPDERRAAGLGLIAAVVVVLVQLGVGAAWSLGNDDPTVLDLARQCFERDKGLTVEATRDDPVAASASGGSFRTDVQGGLVTVSVARSQDEVERLLAAYAAHDDPGRRLDVHGRYVYLWLREPQRGQRQVTYDCAY